MKALTAAIRICFSIFGDALFETYQKRYWFDVRRFDTPQFLGFLRLLWTAQRCLPNAFAAINLYGKSVTEEEIQKDAPSMETWWEIAHAQLLKSKLSVFDDNLSRAVFRPDAYLNYVQAKPMHLSFADPKKVYLGAYEEGHVKYLGKHLFDLMSVVYSRRGEWVPFSALGCDFVDPCESSSSSNTDVGAGAGTETQTKTEIETKTAVVHKTKTATATSATPAFATKATTTNDKTAASATATPVAANLMSAVSKPVVVVTTLRPSAPASSNTTSAAKKRRLRQQKLQRERESETQKKIEREQQR